MDNDLRMRENPDFIIPHYLRPKVLWNIHSSLRHTKHVANDQLYRRQNSRCFRFASQCLGTCWKRAGRRRPALQNSVAVQGNRFGDFEWLLIHCHFCNIAGIGHDKGPKRPSQCSVQSGRRSRNVERGGSSVLSFRDLPCTDTVFQRFTRGIREAKHRMYFLFFSRSIC